MNFYKCNNIKKWFMNNLRFIGSFYQKKKVWKDQITKKSGSISSDFKLVADLFLMLSRYLIY